MTLNVEQPEPNLAEATIILNLRFGAVRNTKKIDAHSDVITTEVDRDRLRITKDLFDAPELNACWNYQAMKKMQIRNMSVPATHLRGGMFMVKTEVAQRVDDILEEAVIEFRPIVQAFADVVDKRRDDSKEKLGPAYNEADFPTPAQVLDAFRIEWKWVALTTPSSLKKISLAFFEKEAAKAEAGLKSAVADITTLLALEAKKLSEHMVERLTPDPATGKAKVFHKSLVSNVSKFLEDFSFKNVVSNADLDTQIEKIRKLMEGVSPDDLRSSDRLREDVAAGFKDVQAALDSIVVAKPRRFLDTDAE